MNVTEIRKVMEPEVEARGCFIVEITVSSDNDIEFVFEKEEGIVDMGDCVALNDIFLDKFDRDIEDYALTMTSAGLDQPFKVLKQYKKSIGEKVEAKIKGGKKLIAVLTDADEESITLKYSVKEAVEGKKKKELVEHIDTFPMSEVNSVRPYIEF
ncbi:MAG: ribosome assembly cofactor RimP [Bacteroidales bacterium]|nr:ribosome assembly cofactor RimP [Bacteroidales bacterium]